MTVSPPSADPVCCEQFAFEKESLEGKDYRITTETFLERMPEVSPTLTEESIRELEEDSSKYSRY